MEWKSLGICACSHVSFARTLFQAARELLARGANPNVLDKVRFNVIFSVSVLNSASWLVAEHTTARTHAA